MVYILWMRFDSMKWRSQRCAVAAVLEGFNVRVHTYAKAQAAWNELNVFLYSRDNFAVAGVKYALAEYWLWTEDLASKTLSTSLSSLCAALRIASGESYASAVYYYGPVIDEPYWRFRDFMCDAPDEPILSREHYQQPEILEMLKAFTACWTIGALDHAIACLPEDKRQRWRDVAPDEDAGCHAR